MKKILMLTLAVALLAGCEGEREKLDNQVALKARNAFSLSNDPEVVGTLKDGRVLYRYNVYKLPCDLCKSVEHTVYLLDGVTTVNWTPEGKNPAQRATVSLPPAEPEGKSVDERAEWKRLNAIYGEQK